MFSQLELSFNYVWKRNESLLFLSLKLYRINRWGRRFQKRNSVLRCVGIGDREAKGWIHYPEFMGTHLRTTPLCLLFILFCSHLSNLINFTVDTVHKLA